MHLIKYLLTGRCAVWGAVLCGVAVANAEPDARALMGAIEQWVALVDTQHRERVEWETARASLEQGIDLLTREKELLTARIDEHAAAADAVTDEKLAEEQRRTDQDRALRDATAQLAAWLGSDTEHVAPLTITLSEVCTDAVAALRQHQAIRLDPQLLASPDGTERLMDVLYLGHAQAYAVARNDQTAAHGVWNGAAWTWEWDPYHAPAIREAVRVQQGERAPRWTLLPITVLPAETVE